MKACVNTLKSMNTKHVRLNADMDGFLCESDWFQSFIGSYLCVQWDVLEIFDTNHSVNNSGYQIIGF